MTLRKGLGFRGLGGTSLPKPNPSTPPPGADAEMEIWALQLTACIYYRINHFIYLGDVASEMCE